MCSTENGQKNNGHTIQRGLCDRIYISCFAYATSVNFLLALFADGSLSGGQTGDGNIAPSDNKNQGGIPGIRGLSYIQKSILPFYVKGRILSLSKNASSRYARAGVLVVSKKK